MMEIKTRICWRRRLATLMLAALSLLAGCGESEIEIWLNIDGSGRATVKRTINTLLSGDSSELPGSNQRQSKTFKDQIASLIKKSSGIDAWQDIRIEQPQEKSLIFYGTAYFSDINQLNIAPFHPSFYQGFQFNLQQPDIEQPGRFRIVYRPPPDTPDWSTVPAAQWRAIPLTKIKAWRQEQRFTLALTPGFLALIPAQVKVHLPGDIAAVHNLEQVDANTILLVMDPLDLAESWIGVAKDDTMIARALAITTGKTDQGHAVRHTLGMAFAAQGPYWADIQTVREPWFDYPTIMEAARSAEAVMWEKLGSEDDFAMPVTLPPSGVSLRGAVWRHDVVADKAGRWHWNQPTCRVYIQAELAVAAAGTLQAKIRKALCPRGQTLLSKPCLTLSYNQISRSRDKRAVLLSVDLAAPASGSTTVAELEGVIEYKSERVRHEIDLGFTALTPGATGKRFDARIARISKGLWSGTAGETLRFTIERRSGFRLHGIVIITPDGNKLTCKSELWHRSGEHGFEIMLSEGGTIPRDATIALDVSDPPRKVEIPFAFTNIPIHATMPDTQDNQ